MKTFQKKISLLLVVVVNFGLAPVVSAQDDTPQKQVFYVSGYYSPQPGQSFYLRGDLEKEKKLNGNGVRGASGKAVYSGMIAAPKSYAFGTKIKLEGLGVATVDDRGGAIVEAGSRGNSYDRLDIWMGYGEEGLKRALSWGLRKVTGYVYPAGSNVANTLDIQQIGIGNFRWPSSASSTTLLKKNLGKNDTGADVEKLQGILVELGYLEANPPDVYNSETMDAVYRFQVDNAIVKRDTDKGAGYTGEKTRQTLEKKWYELKEQERKMSVALKTEKQKFVNTFPSNLGKKSPKQDVTALQQGLTDLGYEVGINGVYDTKTIQAVLTYQKTKGIVTSDKEYGAGYFGNQTKLFLVEDLWQKKQPEKKAQILASLGGKDKAVPVAPVLAPAAVAATPKEPFGKNLDKSSNGAEVIELQSGLTELGFFDGDATGYYGPKTQEAVLNFQKKYKLAGSESSPGAGIFGKMTREKWKIVWNSYQNRKLKEEMDSQDKGIEVAKLQNLLDKLGYFGGEVTGLFGKQTRDALLRFQLENNIIEDSASLGAGRVGQATMKALNQKLIGIL